MNMRRILLYGPPLAGKCTILQAFADERGLPLRQFNPLAGVSQEVIDRGLRVPGEGGDVIDRGLNVVDQARDVGIATIWGAFWNLNSWPTLLARADLVVLVLDPQSSRDAANRECAVAADARATAIRRGCVVWTKQDLALEAAERASPDVLKGTVAEDWRVFRTRADSRQSMLAPLEWLIDSA